MRAPLLVYALLGLVLLFGAYEGGWHRIGGQDWNFFLSQSQAEVSSLQHWGQFPLWAPWRRGGQVSFAQAQSLFLSPVTPVALALGVVAAYKLLLLPIFLLGCLGLHALSGQLRLTGIARFVPALVFFGSSIFPLHVRGGLPNYLFAFALLPWILYALRRARTDLRWLAPAALFVAGLFLCGGIYQFVFFPLYLLLDGAAESVTRSSARPLLLLFVALLAAFCLAAPRVLPVADVYAQYPRPVTGSESHLSLPLALRAWLDPQVPDLDTPQSAFVTSGRAGVYWIYAGAFVGPLALLLAAFGVRAWKRTGGLLLAGAVFLWLSLGSGATPSLWDALHALPIFGSMRFPERLLALSTFSVALLAGHGFEQCETWLRSRRRRTPGTDSSRSAPALATPLLLALALAALVVPALVVNAPLSREAFNVDPTPGLTRQHAFRQEQVEARPEQWGGEMFESVLANVGNPNGMSDIPTPPAVRAFGEPGYRGEVYLLARRGSVLSQITPNEIIVQCRLSEPDVLIVNQNYFPGWRVSSSNEPTMDAASSAADGGAKLLPGVGSELVNHDDLLALPLPPGNHHLRLVYAPASVPRGFLCGGVAALIVGTWWLVRTRRGRGGATEAARDVGLDGTGAPVRATRVGALDVAALLLLGGVAAGMGTALRSPAPAPLAEELSWVQGALLVDGGASEADVAAGRAFRNVADALARARARSAEAAAHGTDRDARGEWPFGPRIVVRPGHYDGFRVDLPVLIAALSGGTVTIRTPIDITNLAAGERAGLLSLGREKLVAAGGIEVHDGAGCAVLQSLTITTASGSDADAADDANGSSSPRVSIAPDSAPRTCALDVRNWGRVELIGCSVQPGPESFAEAAVRVRAATLVSMRSTIDGGGDVTSAGAGGAASAGRVGAGARGTAIAGRDADAAGDGSPIAGNDGVAASRTAPLVRDSAVGVAGLDALLLLNETVVRGGGGPAPGVQGAPALRLVHSRLVGTSANQLAWRGGDGAPAFTLSRGSRARLCGVVVTDSAPWVEAGSTLDLAPLPLVTLDASRFFGGSVLQLDLSAAPGTEGRIVVSLYTALESTPDPLAWLQFDVSRPSMSEAVTLPESGTLKQLLHIPFDESVPGRGLFVQFVSERRPGTGDPVYSLLDGALAGARIPLP